MPERKETLYDVLGVPRDAKLTDVTRAYNRHLAQIKREDAAPDFKRETRIREAYETLSDDGRREAYDQSLVAPDRNHRSHLRAAAVTVFGIAIVAAWFFFIRPPAEAGPPPRPPQDILADVSISVAAVQAIELTGVVKPMGSAFAIGENVLVGTCGGMSPSATLVVLIPPRQVPAQVLSVDEDLGLCRIAAKGTGSRPLSLATAEPKGGGKVYAARIDSTGNPTLIEGKLERVLFEPKAKMIEATAVVPGGSPLLDAQGRLLGVATKVERRFVPVPRAWISEALEPFKEEKSFVPQPAEPPAAAQPGQADAKALEHLTPEQRKRLENAYRPPPDTKDEWTK